MTDRSTPMQLLYEAVAQYHQDPDAVFGVEVTARDTVVALDYDGVVLGEYEVECDGVEWQVEDVTFGHAAVA